MKRNMNEVDYMQMKNRCRLRTATGIALFSFYPTNIRHHSTCAIELHFCVPPMNNGNRVFLIDILHYWWLVIRGDGLIVRDIVVSVTLHPDIVIIFHVAATRVLQLTIILDSSGVLFLFLLTHVCFIVHMTFNISLLTPIDHPSTLYCTILLQPTRSRKYLSDLSSFNYGTR